MKGMFKKVIAIFIAIIMMAALVAACGGGGGSSGQRGDVKITWMAVNASPTGRTDAIFDAINDYLAGAINVELIPRSVDQEAMQITLTGLTGVDLIMAADYVGFYDNARQGAYAEIPVEMIREHMPVWYAENSDKLAAATVDGKIFGIPGSHPGWNAPCAVLRRDWFPEGLTTIRGLDDLYTYLAYVLETQPGVVPFNIDNGSFSWINGAFAFAATFLMAPGGPNCTSPVVFDKRDHPNYVLLENWSQPQLVPFFEVMKNYAEAGFWSPDAMNNPLGMWESFRTGQSGMQWITNIESLHGIWESIQQHDPNADLYVYDFGRENNVPIDTYSPMGGNVSIPMNGENMEYVLKLLELLYTDQTAFNLVRYGVEGEDWELNDNGEIVIFDVEAGIGYWGITGNRDLEYVPDGGYWPGFFALEDEIRAREQFNPFVGFGLDTTPIADISNNWWTEVHMMYGVPVYMGFVDNVQEGINEVVRAGNLVGFDQFYDEAFRQLEAYVQQNFPGGEYTISRAPGR